MYKTIAVAALLLAAFVFTSGNRSADASPTTLPSPVIVARVALLGQTATIPTTTLFTPKVSGLFRISAYLAMTTQGTTGGVWTFQVGWTDEAGAEAPTEVPLYVTDNQRPPNAFAWGQNISGEQTVILRAIANTPVTYTVFGDASAGGAYEVFITAERLE
jgi:hypothetical protein